MAGVFCLLFFAAGAPTPLYGIYRAQLRFSATTLTAVFAIYALVLLLTLLVFGSVSDYLGRRRDPRRPRGDRGRVRGVPGRAQRRAAFAARALQGVAVGTATGALGAALIDLQPEGSGLAPLITTAAPPWGWSGRAGGQRAGPVPAGAHPPGVGPLLGASVAAAAGILAMPEPGTRRAAPWPRSGPGWACPARRAGRSPPRCRACRGVGAVGPVSVARAVAGRAGDRLAGPAVGRPAVFLLTGVAAGATVAFRGVTPRTAMRPAAVLLAGLAVTFAAIATITAAAFLPEPRRPAWCRAGAAGRQPHLIALAPPDGPPVHRRHLHHLLLGLSIPS